MITGAGNFPSGIGFLNGENIYTGLIKLNTKKETNIDSNHFINSLIGEILTHIDIFDKCEGKYGEQPDEILLTTKSGRQFKIHHNQDCCEWVHIENTEGDWKELIGKVIVSAGAEEIVQGGEAPAEYADHWTRTNLTFSVDGATVISRWIGESNGWYSESVDFAEIK